MTFIETYGKELTSALVPLITWVLNTFFRPKVKLQLANPHSFTFLVQEPLLDQQRNQISPTQTVHTSSFMLQNSGRESATNVELVFNWKPPCLNIWPSRHTTEYTEPDNRYVLVFDSLAPNEIVGFELLSLNVNLPPLVTARCEQAVAQPVAMYPQPVVKAWTRRASVVLKLLGFGLLIYLLILLLQFLILRTP